MNLYRVNYPVNGMPKTSFVVAATDNEASYFVGVRDGSAAVSEVAKNVEVIGVDSPHAEVVPIPPAKAEFDLPKAPSMAAFNALQNQVAALTAQLAGQGKKVSTDQP